MKKIIIFLVLSLVGLKSNGQGYDNPILPRIYEDGYSIEQIRNFALDSTEFSKNYRKKLLEIINKGLLMSGEFVNINYGKPLDESYIIWIYKQVVRNQKDSLPAGYSNTYKKGNMIGSYKSKNPYYGPTDEFIYGNCKINLNKPNCGNLLGDMDIVFKQTTDIITNTKQSLLPNYLPRASEIKTTPEDDWIPPGTIQEAGTMEIPGNDQTADVLIPQKKKKTWVGKNLPWIIPSVFAIGTGILIADHNDWWRAGVIPSSGGQGVDPPPVGGGK